MVIVKENTPTSSESPSTVDSKTNKFIDLLQKPFDFISMIFQFIMYFMMKMATEGCMLPMSELEDGAENNNESGSDEDEEEEKKKN